MNFGFYVIRILKLFLNVVNNKFFFLKRMYGYELLLNVIDYYNLNRKM